MSESTPKLQIPDKVGPLKSTDREIKYTIQVYLINGVVFEYDVDSPHKVREHASAIIQTGYRHNDGKGEFEHFAPHRIDKVKCSDNVIPTKYPDRITGT